MYVIEKEKGRHREHHLPGPILMNFSLILANDPATKAEKGLVPSKRPAFSGGMNMSLHISYSSDGDDEREAGIVSS